MCLRRYDYSRTLTADIFAKDLSRPHQSRPICVCVCVLRSSDIGNMRGNGRPCCRIGTQRRCIFDRESDQTDRSVTINYSIATAGCTFLANRRNPLSGKSASKGAPRLRWRIAKRFGNESLSAASTEIIINFLPKGENVQIECQSISLLPLSSVSVSLSLCLSGE